MLLLSHLLHYTNLMARILSQVVLLRHSLSSRLLGPASLIRAHRARSTLSGEAQLIEVDLDPASSSSSSSASDGESEALMIRKLDDVVQRIIVQKSTPDWLPFIPGSSFWVPPRRNSVKFVDLVGKLADQLSEEETLSLATDRGWPCSDFFIHGTGAGQTREVNVEADKSAEMEVEMEVKVLTNSQNTSRFEDEEG